MIRGSSPGKNLELTKVKTKADKGSFLKQICDEFGFEYVPSQIFSSVIQLKPGVACIDCAKQLKLLHHLRACHRLINSEIGFVPQTFLEHATITLLREILPGKELEELTPLANKLLALIKHSEVEGNKLQDSPAQLSRRANLLASFLEQSLVQAGYPKDALDDTWPADDRAQLIAEVGFIAKINSLAGYSQRFGCLFNGLGFTLNTTLFSAEVKYSGKGSPELIAKKKALANLVAECHYVINIKQRLYLDGEYLRNKITAALPNFIDKNSTGPYSKQFLEHFVNEFIDLMDKDQAEYQLQTKPLDANFESCPLPMALLYQLLHKELTEAGQEMASSSQLFKTFDAELELQLVRQNMQAELIQVEFARDDSAKQLAKLSARLALISPWREANIARQVAQFQRATRNLDASLNKFIRNLTANKLSREQFEKNLTEWVVKQCSENILQLLTSPLLDWLDAALDSRSLLESFNNFIKDFFISPLYLEVIKKAPLQPQLATAMDNPEYPGSKRYQRFLRCKDSLKALNKLRGLFLLRVKDGLLQVNKLKLPHFIASSIQVQDEIVKLERLHRQLFGQVKNWRFDSELKKQLRLEYDADFSLGHEAGVRYFERALRRTESIANFRKGLVALTESRKDIEDECLAYTESLKIVDQIIKSKQLLAELYTVAQNEPAQLTQALNWLDQEKALLEESNDKLNQRQLAIETALRDLLPGPGILAEDGQGD